MRVVRLAIIVSILLAFISAWASPEIALAAGTSTPTQGAMSLVVTKLADTNDGACDADCSLREAVVAAPWNGLITFAPGLSGTITLTGEIAFAKSLTINGPMVGTITLDGNALGHILNFDMTYYAAQNALLTLSWTLNIR